MSQVSWNQYSKKYPDRSYKDVRAGNFPCFYCGVDSSQIDHFIPQAHIKSIKSLVELEGVLNKYKEDVWRDQQIIPSCGECNRLASDGLFSSPNQKKDFIKAKLAKRYERIMDLPDWGEKEIEILDYGLQQTVKGGLHDRRMIRERLAW